MLKFTTVKRLEHALGLLDALTTLETNDEKIDIMNNIYATFNEFLYNLYETEYMTNDIKEGATNNAE